jgi:starch phosphorylase
VYLLDADLPENAAGDRRLTDSLYGGDDRYRLCQELLLGIGGVQMLRALGHDRIERFHLNEGHAALAVLRLLEEAGVSPRQAGFADAFASVRERCVFTTHTPVPAGHDRFPRALAQAVLGAERCRWLSALELGEGLNLTELALRGAAFVNGVAMRHGEVSRDMFPGYPIRSITNGIHPPTWASPPMRDLFDRHIPDWRQDPLSLRYAAGIPLDEVRAAHERSKQTLVQTINRQTNAGFTTQALTLGFARRATAYKRVLLIFRDVERLAAIAEEVGPLQIILAGKAHPADGHGKELIRGVFEARERLRGRVPIAYLPNYDMDMGRLLCAGSDVWLNTPLPPLEASGTSGMKAALNGVPSLSVLDGWWVEGHVEGVTGWAIGSDGDGAPADCGDAEHAEALYQQLSGAVLPTFYGNPDAFDRIRRYTISLNASFFNTQRMLLQYLYNAYAGDGAG